MEQNNISPADKALGAAVESVKIQADNLASVQRIEAKLDVLIDRVESLQVIIDQKNGTPELTEEFFKNLTGLQTQLVQSENAALRKLAEEMGDWIRKVQKDSLGAYDAIGLILSKTQSNRDLRTEVAGLKTAIASLSVQLQIMRLGEGRA
jgi:hypothetical protein